MGYYSDYLPRVGDCCGIFVRLLLFVAVLVNLGIASTLISRFTTFNGINVPNAQPPAPIIFSEVMSAVSTAWIVLSFCLLRVSTILMVGDTVFFVGWFAATVIVGISLTDTLRFTCQQLAIGLTGGIGVQSFGVAGSFGNTVFGGFGSQGGFGGGMGQESLAQQIFDSCNISKTLFAFHVIATILFIGAAMSAAIAAASSRRGIKQQNNFHGTYNGSGRRQQPLGQVPEIIV